MRSRKLNYLLAGLALLTLYGCPNKWEESYDYDGKKAFDTYALYELIGAREDGVILVTDTLTVLSEDTIQGASYVFVGDRPYYSELAVTELLAFVERGNTALIAANGMSQDLAYHLFSDGCFYEDYYGFDYYQDFSPDTFLVFEFANGDTLHLPRFLTEYGHSRRVQYVPEELLCDSLLGNEPTTRLWSGDSSVVASIRFPWGEGAFYFDVNPIYYTNYYVADERHHRLAESMAARLGEGPVYWDAFSKYYPQQDAPKRQRRNNRGYAGGRNLLTGNEALLYIQEQPPLAFAWYTLVVAGLLFVLFRGKRRQRVIPEIAFRENSSKRFIDTISRLIFEQGNHRALARREVAQLRYYLNERYHLRWKEKELPPPELAEKLGIDDATAEQLTKEIRFLRQSRDYESGDLMRLHRTLSPLYEL